MAKPGEVITAPQADAPLKEGEIPTSSEIALGDDEKTTPVPDGDEIVAEVRTITGFKWFLACLAMFSANLLYGLDTTIVADIQAAVAETYDDITKLGWLGIGFMLGSVAFILPLGKAYAVFDTKWLFLGCLTMFAAASALCGAAPSMNAIIIGRIWAGAGGAGMYLGNINYITTITTPSEQPVYIGMIGLSFGSGLILGPVVGGLFSDSTLTWRWAFYINLLIFGAMTPLYFFVLPSKPRRPGTTFVQRLKSIDILGVLLNAGMYVSFVLFCTFGGSTWSWSDGRTIACIIIFVILLVSFAITQIYCVWTTHDDRLFPCEMVFDRTLVLLFVCTAASSSCIFVTIYYVPLYFQFVNNDSGTQSAIRLLPFVSFYFATVYCCGRFMGQTGYFILWFIASGIFLTIGGALMYTVKLGTHVANIYGYTILTALGTATSQAAYALAPTMVTPNRIPEAIQFMNIAQCGSLLLALAIANAIFQNGVFDGLRKIFEPLGHSDKDISGAIAGARSTLLTGSSTEVRREALDVITQTTDNVYLMVVAGGALFLVCSCLLPRKR